MIVLWAVVTALGVTGMVLSFRAGLLSETSKPKGAASFAALVISLGVVLLGLAMIANSGDSIYLL